MGAVARPMGTARANRGSGPSATWAAHYCPRKPAKRHTAGALIVHTEPPRWALIAPSASISRASLITPRTADAATVYGDPR
jgi:hypothetical protein